MNIQELMDRMAENLSVKRSFGAAYEKDGTLVIPVAFVSGGGGGGEGPSGASEPGDMNPDEAVDANEDAPSEAPTGSGGGFGGAVIPLGVYVVKDDEVKWVPVISVNLIVVASLMFVAVMARTFRRKRRRH
jgi:uncharacterized spore protein YtfJ